jgi:hypothetical protein
VPDKLISFASALPNGLGRIRTMAEIPPVGQTAQKGPRLTRLRWLRDRQISACEGPPLPIEALYQDTTTPTYHGTQGLERDLVLSRVQQKRNGS